MLHPLCLFRTHSVFLSFHFPFFIFAAPLRFRLRCDAWIFVTLLGHIYIFILLTAEKGLRIRIANLFFKLLTCVLYIIRVVTDLDPTFAHWWVLVWFFYSHLIQYFLQAIFPFCVRSIFFFLSISSCHFYISCGSYHRFRAWIVDAHSENMWYLWHEWNFYHHHIADNKSVHHFEHQMNFILTQWLMRFRKACVRVVFVSYASVYVFECAASIVSRNGDLSFLLITHISTTISRKWCF